jgi:hypothetical protein
MAEETTKHFEKRTREIAPRYELSTASRERLLAELLCGYYCLGVAQIVFEQQDVEPAAISNFTRLVLAAMREKLGPIKSNLLLPDEFVGELVSLYLRDTPTLGDLAGKLPEYALSAMIFLKESKERDWTFLLIEKLKIRTFCALGMRKDDPIHAVFSVAFPNLIFPYLEVFRCMQPIVA